MKTLLYCLLVFLFTSCTSNHYHDGIYKGTVYAGGSLFNTHEEVLTVKGNEILVEKYTLGGSLAEKLKVSCTQFPDRIEFKEREGVTKILTVADNGDLQLNEAVVFHKLNPNEEVVVTKQEAKPLIRNNGDGTITLLPEKGKTQEVSSTVENESALFEGTKRFSDGDAWDYVVTIRGSNITLKLYPNISNDQHSDKKNPTEVIKGYIEGSKIITPDNTFKIENGALYELNNEGNWNEYGEVNQ